MASMTEGLRAALTRRGVECLIHDGHHISDQAVFEPPCGLKWMTTAQTVHLGAFSYGVSGFFSEVEIGRDCSFGETIQVGRGSHPADWMSTSPFFYAGQGRMLDVGPDFEQSRAYDQYRPASPGPIAVRNARTTPDLLQRTTIGHDVWIGHGAFILPGVTIGNGAVIAGQAVVSRNVAPYAVVGGNPARLLRMRFTEKNCAMLQQLAWWRFPPWQLRGIPFANIENAIAHLVDLVPSLEPYLPAKVTVAGLA